MALEMPHFYSNKKYIGINRQRITRDARTYTYTGGKASIDGCLYHLNNINAVCGCILTLTHFLAKKAGIHHQMFRSPPEQLDIVGGSGDEGLKGLVDSNFRSLATTLTAEAAKTNNRIKALEARVSKLKDLIETVQNSIDELSHELTC